MSSLYLCKQLVYVGSIKPKTHLVYAKKKLTSLPTLFIAGGRMRLPRPPSVPNNSRPLASIAGRRMAFR